MSLRFPVTDEPNQTNNFDNCITHYTPAFTSRCLKRPTKTDNNYDWYFKSMIHILSGLILPEFQASSSHVRFIKFSRVRLKHLMCQSYKDQ